jgi:hydroxyacylglutathione hydrolase
LEKRGTVFIDRVVVGPVATNCHVLISERFLEGMIVDPGARSDIVMDLVTRLGRKIPSRGQVKFKYVVNTHGHFDHIAANREVLEKTGAKLLIHESDSDCLGDPNLNGSIFFGEKITSPGADLLLKGGEKFKLGDEEIEIIHTPGHSRGSISLLVGGTVGAEGKLALTGDALFFESIGRTDLFGGDHALLLESIRSKLFKLSDDVKVFPGHGNETTIGHEKRFNPFVGDGEYRPTVTTPFGG